MGIVVRTKDKLFVAVAIPAAVAAGYFYFYRDGAVKRNAELERQNAALADEAAYHATLGKIAADEKAAGAEKAKAQAAKTKAEADKAAADAALAAALQELAAEKAIALPPPKVVADPKAAAAVRENAFVELARKAGLTVASMEYSSEISSAGMLRATGSCPSPISRKYVLEGQYWQVQQLLAEISGGQLAVIVGKLQLNESGVARWILEVAL